LVNSEDNSILSQNYGQEHGLDPGGGGGGGFAMMAAGGERGGVLSAESLIEGGMSAEELAQFVLDMDVIADLREKIAKAEPAYLGEFDEFVARWSWLGDWMAGHGVGAGESLGAAMAAEAPEPGGALISTLLALRFGGRRGRRGRLPRPSRWTEQQAR
jgi:hypothetical protein